MNPVLNYSGPRYRGTKPTLVPTSNINLVFIVGKIDNHQLMFDSLTMFKKLQ